jgi:hypothetical protein
MVYQLEKNPANETEIATQAEFVAKLSQPEELSEANNPLSEEQKWFLIVVVIGAVLLIILTVIVCVFVCKCCRYKWQTKTV